MQRGHHEVTSECRLDGCFRRFQVARFPHQQHVRVLTHEGPQGRGEIQTLVTVHLGLGDAVEGVFDRILNRGDVDAGVVAFGQQGVQGRRLAGAGRARDQNHAVGLGSQLPQGLPSRNVGDQGVQAQLGGAAVEQAHHHLLAAAAGQGAHAEVHLAAPEHPPDPAVLGQAPLGDVQVGHDLQPGGHRRSQAPGQVLEVLLQHPIDPEADFQGLFLGFDVNVTGATGEGLDQDPVHQAHDR